MTEKLLQGILDTTPGSLSPTLNAATVNRLSSNTGTCVDVSCIHSLILVSNPCHFALTSAHIWSWDVLRWMDQITFDQFISKATRDLL